MSNKQKKKVGLVTKIIKYRQVLYALPYSIYFNFHYLEFKQACKLPILLHKPKLLKCSGSIAIKSKFISFGMIRLGFYNVSLYPNSGITWENHGGTVIFYGRCSIGNNSCLSIGQKGCLILGDNFQATSTLKLVVYNKIEFNKNVLVGWDNLFMDTDFHKIKKISGEFKSATKPIKIGNDNWFGTNCLILKGTETPNFCIFGARSVLNKKYEFESYSLASGNPLQLKLTGVYRDTEDDTIDYESLGEILLQV